MGRQEEEEGKGTVYALILSITLFEVSFLPSDSKEKRSFLHQRRENQFLCFDSGQIQMSLEVSTKTLAGTDLMSSCFSIYGSQNLPLVGKKSCSWENYSNSCNKNKECIFCLFFLMALIQPGFACW